MEKVEAWREMGGTDVFLFIYLFLFLFCICVWWGGEIVEETSPFCQTISAHIPDRENIPLSWLS